MEDTDDDIRVSPGWRSVPIVLFIVFVLIVLSYLLAWFGWAMGWYGLLR